MNHEMIIYEDNHIIVCHKPAGLPVQSARISQRDMVSILNNHLAEKKESGEIYVIHRLDQPVEGVVVFGKTGKAAAALSRQIASGNMKKVYQAVCCVTEQAKAKYGLAGEKEYLLEDYLVKNGKTNISFVGKKGDREAKLARLTFRIVKKGVYSVDNCDKNEPSDGKLSTNEKMYALVEIHLETGRHHQIRVQMANAGLPLCGDQKYNPSENHGFSLALCATALSFFHPITGKKMEFLAEPENPVFHFFG